MAFVKKIASLQLEAWRKRQKLSQKEAAKMLGVSQPTYSEYETGRKTPRTAKAFEIQEKTRVKAAGWTVDAPEAKDPAA